MTQVGHPAAEELSDVIVATVSEELARQRSRGFEGSQMFQGDWHRIHEIHELPSGQGKSFRIARGSSAGIVVEFGAAY